MKIVYTDKELKRMNSQRLSDLWVYLFYEWGFRTRGKNALQNIATMGRIDAILTTRGVWR